MKKLISIILLCACIFSTQLVYADEIEEEIIEIDKIKQEVIETSANVAEEPSINSRVAVVIDRNSKEVLYSKNMNQKYAMASTTNVISSQR